MDKAIRNIGILSHVDAGKTTITENFLFLSGAIRKKGSVDDGFTITDSLDIERKRGISVKSSIVSFEWKDVTINLLDTPGHVDFSSEVQRVLGVLDGAIIVISAVEGVQAYTITLVEALKDLRIPFIIFINKFDRDGADIELVLKSIKKDLKIDTVLINIPHENLNIIFPWETNSDSEIFEHISEPIIELDDILMSKYIEGSVISRQELWQSASKSIKDGLLKPVLCGIAKNGIGIKELLDSIIDFIPAPKQENSNLNSVLVYKIEHNKKLGKLAYVKVFSGEISSKEVILNNRIKSEIKLGVLKKVQLNKLEDVPILKIGEIGVISGAENIRVGDILGDKSFVPKIKSDVEPVMITVIKPVNGNDFNKLKQALEILNLEDPLLNMKSYKQTNEFEINIVGPIQIEILENQILNRFNIEVVFENPTVIYKERPLKKAEGFVRYWMPKPCWAIMTFEIEPGEIGSGIVYKSKVRQSDIHQKYQNEVKRTIPKVLEQGIKGWEVTDAIITLVDGEDHNIHSRPGDFELATYMGIMRALDNAGTELLEPILKFSINAPEENLGIIASDLTKMRATFANPVFDSGSFQLTGTIPAATSMDYSIKLSSLTSGRGRIRLKFHNYDVCPPNAGVIKEYKGVNPLDESQWILHRRGAYKAEDRRM